MATQFSTKFMEKAEEIYSRLAPTIEKKYPGQFIVIHPFSSQYHIAPKLRDALKAALEMHPDGNFVNKKIGSPSAFVFS